MKHHDVVIPEESESCMHEIKCLTHYAGIILCIMHFTSLSINFEATRADSTIEIIFYLIIFGTVIGVIIL
jgi:hypothetical protein